MTLLSTPPEVGDVPAAVLIKTEDGRDQRTKLEALWHGETELGIQACIKQLAHSPKEHNNQSTNGVWGAENGR